MRLRRQIMPVVRAGNAENCNVCPTHLHKRRLEMNCEH